MAEKSFEELHQLESLIALNHDLFEVKVVDRVSHKGNFFPIYSLKFGGKDRKLPTFGLFGGVHGLERVGTRVVVSFLRTLVEQMKWDEDLNSRLQNCRVVSIPLINPGGMYMGSRSNLNGVDLMRNAPIEAKEWTFPFFGGHRWSRHLPFYRGKQGDPMEKEAQILTNFVKEEMFQSTCAFSLDVHSGFGWRDQLWHPYAKTAKPFERLIEARKMMDAFERTYPYHVYKIEQQPFRAIGDLWDYLFEAHWAENGDNPEKIFLPWTLEMGSWLWVRKNPLQFFSRIGLFNPIKEHRLKRVMRRHFYAVDFFFKAVKNYKNLDRS